MRLIDAARFERRLMFTVDRDEICDDCLRNFLDEMAKEPTIDPAKHGLWIAEGDGYADGEMVYDVWYCSECNHCIDDGIDDPEKLPHYCPNCGAKMDANTDATEATT